MSARAAGARGRSGGQAVWRSQAHRRTAHHNLLLRILFGISLVVSKCSKIGHFFIQG